MADLDMLLAGDEPEERQEDKGNFGFDELHISKYAYEKAFRYAKLVMQGRWGSIEIGGFLTKPRDVPDRVARDAFLARDQEVGRAFYQLDAEDVLKAGKEIEEAGQKIIGWWHSHGKFDTSHSEIDAKNQMVLLNQISPSNYIIVPYQRAYEGLQSRVEGNRIVFWEPNNPSVKFQLELKDEIPEAGVERLKIFEDRRIGFAYSFVVNWHRWLSRRVPYCEIATRDLCSSCVHPMDVSVSVGCRIFDEGEYKIDDAQLMAEINEKVYIDGYKYKKNTRYYLPAVFEKERASGKLTKPNFGKSNYWGTGYYEGDETLKDSVKDTVEGKEPKDKEERK